MVLNKKRLLLGVVTIVSLCLFFWLSSRYPALNEKALMASQGTVADTLSVWPIFEIKESHSFFEKVFLTTLNWLNDNKKGMSFGVFLGGLFLTVISYVQFKQRSSRFMDTFFGFLLGSPIGVCVNCAAPVFKGVLKSKRPEFAFAMMLSSPTMNVVVLTMVFTLFPFYMAVTKVLFTLAVIFLGVPLISRFLGEEHKLKDIADLKAAELIRARRPVRVQESPLQSALGFVKDAAKNIGYIIYKTVPLMFVAGFLGSLFSYTIPLEDLLKSEPGILSLMIASLVGVFLPMPVAFDVILTNALFTAGLPAGLTLALLCTLGIFSIYSLMIVWRSASKHWALLLSGLAVVLGLVVGLSGKTLHRSFYILPNIANYKQLTSSDGRETIISQTMGAKRLGPTRAAVEIPWKAFEENQHYKIERADYYPRDEILNLFQQHEGQVIGVDEGFRYGIRDYPDPFWIGRGTAAADFDEDGWVDIALGSDRGLFLYRNIGGTFQKVSLGNSQLRKLRVYAISFADFNNDGWKDIFFTTFNKGNYILKNEAGKFGSELVKVKNNSGVLTVAPSIADIDKDGHVDILNGNMALGIITGFKKYGKGRVNSISWGKGNFQFEEQVLDKVDGETMATLVADLNDDGFLDIYYGNDFIVPDYIFWGKGKRTFETRDKKLQKQIFTPIFSMGADTADFNNDLKTDLILTGNIQIRQDFIPVEIDGISPDDYMKSKDSVNLCESIKNKKYKESCIVNRKTNHLIPFYTSKNLNIEDCKMIDAGIKRQDCLLSVMWMIITQNSLATNCEKSFSFDTEIKEVCLLLQGKRPYYRNEQFLTNLVQKDAAHLYLNLGKGRYLAANSAERKLFDHPGGWTWGVKALDVDNDGWLDVFNAEGAVRKGQPGFNVLMHNNREKGFSPKQFSWNLVNPFQLYSFVTLDFDRDGDLDIIGNASVGPVQVYENSLNVGDMVSVKFYGKETKGKFLLGSQVVARTKSGRQLRHINTSGGYQSSQSTWLHFGIGKEHAIESFTLTLPNKKSLTIKGQFTPGMYKVEVL